MKNQNIEVAIASKLARFIDILQADVNKQQQIHDAIYTLENDTPTPEQIQFINQLLNACLSLSFLLVNEEDDVLKFIEYHND